MNTDKAYILGLIIGGGVWGNAKGVFRIRLPYRQWGSYEQNPKRAGQITRDIMSVVSPIFRSTYNITVSFEDGTREWNILCEGDMSELKADLASYGIACEGELRQNATISGVVAQLVDDNLKRRFIAGIADTIGSMAKSQRRFTEEMQIISFEINGFNFAFVCDLCRLLYSVNCIPDQILWNHPNFHCAKAPYYKQWTKGFKLRILLDQYAKFGAFAFRTKAESSLANRDLQQQTHTATPCPERKITISPSCTHFAENDTRLPTCIRGGHYIHNRHVCAVLGCEHAPSEKIAEFFSRSGELIIPFPILHKHTLLSIEQTIAGDSLLANRTYEVSENSVQSLLLQYQSNSKILLYGTRESNGYPITKIMQAIAFVIADDNELSGKRPKGNFIPLIEHHLAVNPKLSVELRRPDLLTPLVICGSGRGALVGADNPDVYAKLVTIAPDNRFKLCVRPITEEDLRNA